MPEETIEVEKGITIEESEGYTKVVLDNFSGEAKFEIKKNSNGELYIIIKQYEVEDEHFKLGDDGVVIFEGLFTDELYYHKKIETKYGYNTILIENGVARVIEANCPHPYSINGCMSSYITNDARLLDTALIRCMQHGISIGWEVRSSED